MKEPPSDPYCKFCGSITHYANRDCPAVKVTGPEWHRWYTPPDRNDWHSTINGITGYVLCAGSETREGGAPAPPRVERTERTAARKPIEPPAFEALPMPVFSRGSSIPVGPAERPKYHPKPGKKA